MWQAPSLGTPPHLPQPKVVTATDAEELRKHLEELRLANEEVAGDATTAQSSQGVERFVTGVRGGSTVPNLL